MPKRVVTVADLKRFAGQFSKEQWRRLCAEQKFLNLVMEDLEKAQALAAVLLKFKS